MFVCFLFSIRLLTLLLLLVFSNLSIAGDAFNFGKVPFLVAEWTDGACFQPALDAIQVKDVAAISKRNGETIVVGRRRIGLILNARFVERISTNGAL
jgi:hypothetical protein